MVAGSLACSFSACRFCARFASFQVCCGLVYTAARSQVWGGHKSRVAVLTFSVQSLRSVDLCICTVCRNKQPNSNKKTRRGRIQVGLGWQRSCWLGLFLSRTMHRGRGCSGRRTTTTATTTTTTTTSSSCWLFFKVTFPQQA